MEGKAQVILNAPAKERNKKNLETAGQSFRITRQQPPIEMIATSA